MEWTPRNAGLRDWPGNGASYWTGNSFPGWSWMRPASREDVWAPNTKTGHLQLFYFAAFIAVLGIGGNITVRHLWDAFVNASNLL